MKKLLILTILLSLSGAGAASAQSMEAGVLVGISEPANNELELDFEDRVKELYVGWEYEEGTIFKLKAGRVDTAAILVDGEEEILTDGTVEYVNAIVEYQFDEVFGSASLFAGPGFYRQEFGDFKEQDWGLAVGIGGDFPITRKFSFIAEAAYHWAHFDPTQAFVNIAGGLKYSF